MNVEQVAKQLEMLSHPVRLRIFELFKHRPYVMPSQVARVLGVSETVSSFHLRRLGESGLLISSRQGAMNIYLINPQALTDLKQAVEVLLGTPYAEANGA